MNGSSIVKYGVIKITKGPIYVASCKGSRERILICSLLQFSSFLVPSSFEFQSGLYIKIIWTTSFVDPVKKIIKHKTKFIEHGYLYEQNTFSEKLKIRKFRSFKLLYFSTYSFSAYKCAFFVPIVMSGQLLT